MTERKYIAYYSVDLEDEEGGSYRATTSEVFFEVNDEWAQITALRLIDRVREGYDYAPVFLKSLSPIQEAISKPE